MLDDLFCDGEWDDLFCEGDIGSEGGNVILDEGYKNACRITLEELTDRYVITCGIYGSMMHTVYCGYDYMDKYNAMKSELERFIDSDLSDDEKNKFYDEFTSKF